MHSAIKKTTQKSAMSVALATFLFILLVSPALALEIQVDRDGNIHVSQGYVLGDNSEDKEEKDKEDEKKEEKKEAVRPLIPASEKQELKVSFKENKARVEMKRQDLPKSTIKVVETENLQMSFPAAEKEVEDKQETEVEHGTEAENEQEKKSTELEREYAEKIREARRQRIKEVVELRERKENGTKSLELNSRDVKAQVDGAEFVLDSETNEVTITTPSGKKHVLAHLPDQALARMKEAGVISDDEFDTENQELQAEATEDGVVYTAEVTEKKKFLSFFPRIVSEKVTLDDATGEVKRESTASGFWGKFLDRFSY